MGRVLVILVSFQDWLYISTQWHL